MEDGFEIFLVPGNHDYNDGGGINEYLNYFTLPGTGVASTNTSGNERYYDFIQDDVHFFMIDSDAAIGMIVLPQRQNTPVDLPQKDDKNIININDIDKN